MGCGPSANAHSPILLGCRGILDRSESVFSYLLPRNSIVLVLFHLFQLRCSKWPQKSQITDRKSSPTSREKNSSSESAPFSVSHATPAPLLVLSSFGDRGNSGASPAFRPRPGQKRCQLFQQTLASNKEGRGEIWELHWPSPSLSTS